MRKVEMMRSNRRALIPVLLTLSVLCWLPAAHAAVLPADVVTVATVTAGSNTVDVPVYIRDTSGTPLGVDQPPGSKIQSYSLKVNYSPASAISLITFTRAGITTTLTPVQEFMPQSAGSISLIDTFQESTNPIPFNLNAALPGDQVGHLSVTLAPTAIPGSTVLLTLDPTLTQLGNEGGTTNETTTNANLALVNGGIVIPPTLSLIVPTLSTWVLILLGMALVAVAIRARS